jgi:hypothetical protein
MAIWLKQSTASQEIPLGFFLDSTDGNAEETGLTIANTDIKLWKNGATTLANKNSGGATHISNGIYYAVLDATDTNTLGPLVVYCHVSGALSVKVECLVLPANIYDSFVAGSDYLDISVVQWKGTAASDIATELQIADAVLDEVTTGHDVASSLGKLIADYVNASIAAVKAQTDLIPAVPASVGSAMDLVDAPSATALNAAADALLDRDIAGGGSGNTRNVRNALRALRNKATISNSTLTVYQENDSTAAWTADVTTAAGNPVTGIDPA